MFEYIEIEKYQENLSLYSMAYLTELLICKNLKATLSSKNLGIDCFLKDFHYMTPQCGYKILLKIQIKYTEK